MKNLVQEKEKIKQELMDKLAVIKNVQLRIALYIDLIDSLDSYAQSVCAEKVSAVRQEIYNAWNIEGRMPSYHRKMQAKLRQEWPVLAKALDQLQQSSDTSPSPTNPCFCGCHPNECSECLVGRHKSSDDQEIKCGCVCHNIGAGMAGFIDINTICGHCNSIVREAEDKSSKKENNG